MSDLLAGLASKHPQVSVCRPGSQFGARAVGCCDHFSRLIAPSARIWRASSYNSMPYMPDMVYSYLQGPLAWPPIQSLHWGPQPLPQSSCPVVGC